jgi:hypothetical protein
MPLWNETAVAVERRAGEMVIIGEGPLASLVAALRLLRPSVLRGVRISMPDRHVPPFMFEGLGLTELLNDSRRPKVPPLQLLPPLAI